MDTRKVASEYRMAQWSQVIQLRAESGQSIKDYCASNGISRNTYFYWQKKLRKAACSELAVQGAETEQAIVPGGWARLEPENPGTPEATLHIEINGCRIDVTPETDSALLTRVCRMLKAL